MYFWREFGFEGSFRVLLVFALVGRLPARACAAPRLVRAWTLSLSQCDRRQPQIIDLSVSSFSLGTQPVRLALPSGLRTDLGAHLSPLHSFRLCPSHLPPPIALPACLARMSRAKHC